MPHGVRFLNVPGDKGSLKSLAARRNGSLTVIKSCCFLLCRKSFQISLTPGPSTVTNRHNCTVHAICKAGSAGKISAPRMCLLFHGLEDKILEKKRQGNGFESLNLKHK